MVGLRRARWLGAVLIAPVLAFTLAAAGTLALRCRVTGLMMPDSCCPPVATNGAAEQPGAQASIGDPACCERLMIATGKVPATVSARSTVQPVLPGALATTSMVSLLPLAAPAHAFALPIPRPPDIAAPHFLLTHSFLI